MRKDASDQIHQRELLFAHVVVEEGFLTAAQVEPFLMCGGRLAEQLVEANLLDSQACEAIEAQVDSLMGALLCDVEPRGAAQPLLDEAPTRYEPAADGAPARGEGELIGQGAQGEVLAIWDTFLEREVAMKTLRDPLGQRPETVPVQRFLREARVLARLDHPGIVPVHELGRRQDGRLYFTMKRVRGVTLSEVTRACRTLDDRLRLLPRFVAVCQAVAYAHSKGVVNCDLKPEHVILGKFGETTVVDWGLARLIDRAHHRGDGEEGVTLSRQAGAVLGTRGYMSPEQERGEPIGPESDVFALGRVLQRILANSVAPELRSIAARASAADPTQRYPDVQALIDDLNTFQEGGLVSAHRYSLIAQTRRWLDRHRQGVRLGWVVITLTSLMGLLMFSRDRRERALLAQRIESELQTALEEGADKARIQILAASAMQLKGETPELRGALIVGRSGWRPKLVIRRAPPPGGPTVKCEEARWIPPRSPVICAAYSRNSTHWWWAEDILRVASAPRPVGVARGEQALSTDGTSLMLCDVRFERCKTALPNASLNGIGSVHLVDTGWVTLGSDGRIQVWGPSDKAPRWESLVVHPRGLNVSPDGDAVIVGDWGGGLRWWQALTGQLLGSVPAGSHGSAVNAASTGHRWVATTGSETYGDLSEIQVFSGRISEDDRFPQPLMTLEGHRSTLMGLAFSPSTPWLLASASRDGTVRLWDVEVGQTLSVIEVGCVPAKGALSFSDDGRMLGVVCEEGQVLAWEIDGAHTRDRLLGHRDAAMGVRWLSQDRLASVGGDGTLRLWKHGREQAVNFVTHVATGALAPLPSGNVLVGAPELLIEADGRTGLEVRRWSVAGLERPYSLAVSPDATTVAVAGYKGLRTLVLSPGGLSRTPGLPSGSSVAGVAFSLEGRSLIASGISGELWSYTVVGGTSGRELATDLPALGRVILSPNGTELAVGDREGRIHRLRLRDGQRVAVMEGHQYWPYALRYGPGEGRLVSGAVDATVRLWDLAGSRSVAVLTAHRNAIWDVDLSPDERFLASASGDRTIGIWDLADLQTPPEAILALARAHYGLTINGADIVEDSTWTPTRD